MSSFGVACKSPRWERPKNVASPMLFFLNKVRENGKRAGQGVRRHVIAAQVSWHHGQARQVWGKAKEQKDEAAVNVLVPPDAML